MSTLENDMELLRRICGEQPKAVETDTPAKEDGPKLPEKPDAKGNGLSDIAGMEELKDLVTEGFINVLKNRRQAEAYGIRPPSMLFYGPAGCGKTFFARKMAEELGINFMMIVPDDLACTWVHGTQQKIGEVFREAEKQAPTLLFFDEFDAMVPQRSGDEGNQHYAGEVNEFLCMLNNASERGVYVLAATNHPERIDKAVLRTGRIDEMVYVDMPDREARRNLFDLKLSKLPAAEDIDTGRLADLTEGFNCSDICYIVGVAARKMFNATVRERAKDCRPIGQGLLEEVIAQRSPSVSGKALREYERVRKEFSPKDKGTQRAAIGFR